MTNQTNNPTFTLWIYTGAAWRRADTRDIARLLAAPIRDVLLGQERLLLTITHHDRLTTYVVNDQRDADDIRTKHPNNPIINARRIAEPIAVIADVMGVPSEEQDAHPSALRPAWVDMRKPAASKAEKGKKNNKNKFDKKGK